MGCSAFRILFLFPLAMVLLGCSAKMQITPAAEANTEQMMVFPTQELIALKKDQSSKKIAQNIDQLRRSQVSIPWSSYPSREQHAEVKTAAIKQFMESPDSDDVKRYALRYSLVEPEAMTSALEVLMKRHARGVMSYKTKWSHSVARVTNQSRAKLVSEEVGRQEYLANFRYDWDWGKGGSYGQVSLRLVMEPPSFKEASKTQDNPVKVSFEIIDAFAPKAMGIKPVADVLFDAERFATVLKEKLPGLYIEAAANQSESPYGIPIFTTVEGAKQTLKEITARINERKRVVASRFRKNLSIGQKSHCGLVVGINQSIVNVETQLGQKWLKRDQVYPEDMAPCQFRHGEYVDFYL